ncbi:UNKNOWN [Stylonychia lemnae]|uniref:Uncharacterized protein n=1 Tax=Stylonychia lemnae TaxID=5949 RepID=A0A078AB67_STYLE|nr:UNKNOWN [Stylonychia lemnae]|eukprot:CDW78023.1 UNKNOWN [Stylonychia lemnae]
MDYLPCGGVIISSNYFTENFGCPLFGGGLIKLSCQLGLQLDQFDNSKPIDAAGMFQTFQIQAIKDKNIILNDLTPDKNKYELSNNYYFKNFNAFNEALVDLRGIMWAHIINETFIQNGENVAESLLLFQNYTTSENIQVQLFDHDFTQIEERMNITNYNMSSLNPDYDPNSYEYLDSISMKEASRNSTNQQTEGYITTTRVLQANTRQSYYYLKYNDDKQSLGLIYIRQCLYLYIKDVEVKDNFVYEYQLNSTKGSFITIKRFFGSIDMKNIHVHNYKGFMKFARDDLGIQFSEESPKVVFAMTNPIIGIDTQSDLIDVSLENIFVEDVKFGLYGDTVDHLKIQNLTLNNIDCNCSKNHSLFQLQTIYAKLVDINVSNINTNYNLMNSAAEFGSQVFQIILKNKTFDQDILSNGYFQSIQGNYGSVFNISFSDANFPLKSQYNNNYTPIITMRDSTFFNITTNHGGAINIFQGFQGRFIIDNCTFNQTKTQYKGGALSLNPETTTSQDDLDGKMAIKYLAIFNCDFIDNYQSTDNGKLTELILLIENSSQFGDSSIPYFNRVGYILYLNQAFYIQIDIRGCQILQEERNLPKEYVADTKFVNDLLAIWSRNQNIDTNFGSAFFIQLNLQQVDLKVIDSNFEGCRFGYLGGVFHLEGMNNNFTINNSTFLNNLGWYGGIAYCSNCQAIVFYKTNISETQAYQGGVLFTEIDKPIIKLQINYIESIMRDIMSCSEGGVNYIITNSYTSLEITLQESRFEKVNASLYDDSSTQKITKTSSDQASFQGGAGFFIVGGVMSSEQAGSIVRSKSTSLGISANLSDNTIRCVLDGDANQYKQYLFVEKRVITSPLHAFIFKSVLNTTIVSKRNKISDCYTEFVTNYEEDYTYLTSGGVYYLDSTTGLLTFNDTQNNHALIQGGDIYQFALEFSTSMNMIIQNSRFQMNLTKYWMQVEKRFVENEIGSMMISVINQHLILKELL